MPLIGSEGANARVGRCPLTIENGRIVTIERSAIYEDLD